MGHHSGTSRNLKDDVTSLESREANSLTAAEISSAAEPIQSRPSKRPWQQTVRDYIALTKPRIIELLLITTFPVMFLAHRGVPDFWLIVATLIGGSASAGSANAYNCYFDRDIDQVMDRTKNRPTATGAISGPAALTFATILGIISVVWLGLLVNWLSAALSFGAMLLYVGFYTLILKRRTAQNIVWGGIAGCIPVLIGWSAVTNSVSWEAFVLFGVVFFWTPPHYWPLSMRFRQEYAQAGVPMLPVVAGDVAVARQILIYAYATVLTSWLLIPIAPMGWIYLATSFLAGWFFVFESHKLLARARRGAEYHIVNPMRLFHFSISYLTLVFIAVAVDPLVYFPI